MSCVLFDKRSRFTDSVNIFFLFPSILSKSIISVLSQWIYAKFNNPAFNLIGLSCSTIKSTHDEIKRKNILHYFDQYRSNYQSIISTSSNKYNVYIPFGYALAELTQNTDLHIDCFTDFIFNKTYFYIPKFQGYVFPCFNTEKFINEPNIIVNNCFKLFNEKQFETIHNLLQDKNFLNKKRIPVLKINQFNSKDELLQFLKSNKNDSIILAIDIETDGFNWHSGKIKCITFSYEPYIGYYIPSNLVEEIKKDTELKQLFVDFLKTKKLIGQNIKFDLKFLYSYFNISLFELPSSCVYGDTYILGNTINEMRSNGLKQLAYYYTTYGGYDDELNLYIEQYKKQYNKKVVNYYTDIDDNVLKNYATKDAIITYLVFHEMIKQLKEIDEKYDRLFKSFFPDYSKSLTYYYENIRMPVLRAFIDIEYLGIYVNKHIWDKNSKYVDNKITEITKELQKRFNLETKNSHNKIVQQSFDFFTEEKILNDNEFEEIIEIFNSPKQLGELLEKNGWEDLGRSKLGVYLTGDNQLTQWENLGHEEATLIKLFRGYQTLKKTFLGSVGSDEGWRKYLTYIPEENTYKIFPTYNVMGAESGRNTCSEPNIQQIPANSLDSHLVKQIISSPDPEKYYIVTVDFSSLQIRLSVIDSEDPLLFEEFKKNPNFDLHFKTGYSVFLENVPIEIPTIEIKTDTGKVLEYYENQEIKVKRNNNVISIKAKDIQENDELIA